MYAFFARKFTTTKLTPAEIHEIGLKEVARIRAEMLEVIERKNHERYADLLLKLTVLRRQNEILLRWASKQDAIALHELEGRNPDDLRRKQVVFEGCDWIDDWKPSVDPWSWEH